MTVALGYNLNQYLFIRGEFWKFHQWIISFSYIFYVCKISIKLKINKYGINKFFLIVNFCSLKLCLKYKLIDHIVNNIRLTQNLTYVLRVWICNSTVRFSKYVVMFILGEKTLLIPTFWTDSHFDSYFDFTNILVPKNRKSILFWFLPLTH